VGEGRGFVADGGGPYAYEHRGSMSESLTLYLATLAGRTAGFLAATVVNSARALLPIAVIFLVIWFFERRQGSDTSRYRRRHFAHDVAYALFYDSGAFRMLGASLIYAAVQDQLSFMRMGLFEGLPIWVVGALFIVINDFISYWLHRAEHAIPFLWQFHSVHHAAEEMNFLTTYRMHPVSKLLWGISGVVLLIVLGVPPTMWLPLTFVQSFLTMVQHSDLDWSYGRLYRILVNPVFHRLHHSRDRGDYDSNYSQLFSVWDYLFGTANPSRTPPVAVGVEGLPSEPTLLGQFLGPFRRLARSGTAPELPAGAPNPQRGDGQSRTLAGRS
jgi:sterol desaturase/sphingolipid hydroxylase (fatty acid hydroxylase superfamily)